MKRADKLAIIKALNNSHALLCKGSFDSLTLRSWNDLKEEVLAARQLLLDDVNKLTAVNKVTTNEYLS